MSAASLRKWLLAPLVLVPLLLVLAVGLYAAAGFWGVPWLIRSQATAYIRDEKHRDLQLGDIRFNPFTFRLEMRDIAVLEHGKRLVALEHLLADYQIASLWKRTHVLREVVLDKPYARAILRKDGSLNLADLLPKTDPNEPLPAVLVQSLSINAGQVDFTDQTRRAHPTKILAPITFALQHFQTTKEGGTARLEARSQDNEALAWNGTLSLTPVASRGQFTLKGLKSDTVEDFVGDMLPMRLTGGTIDLGGRYTFAVHPRSDVQLDAALPKITARDLRVRARGVDEDWITVPAATVNDARFSLRKHAVEIQSVAVNGVQAKVWLQPDGYLNVRQLFAPDNAPPAANDAKDWTVRVASLGVEGAKVSLEDRTMHPAVKFELDPVAATVGGVSLDLTKPLPVKVTATVNGKAPLTIDGTVALDPRAVDVQIELSRLPIQDVFAYLPNFPALKLRSGEVGAKGKFVLRPEGAPGAAMTYDGDASVDHLDLQETSTHRSFLAWERVEVTGLSYAAAPYNIAIRRITVRKPVANVVISPDGKLNLATTLTPAPTTPHAATPGKKLPPLKVDEVALDGAVLGFADYSVLPNFSAQIQALRGQVRNVSTKPGTISRIDLAGHVINQYSPVTIKGTANLLAYDERSDIAMTFRNIELPIFNPYSGTYAGYAIAKGKLTTELEYKIDHRRLVADHHVVIDHLQWGEATESKKKVSLPVRLATSLLKDGNGVIDLKLPVTGSLDDPKFRIWPVVWQMIKTVVVKVVTAPFRWLHSKGAEEGQYVDFAPGSAALPDKSVAALPELATSLSQKPELQLDIPAGPVTKSDIEALDDQRFQAAIAEMRAGTRGADVAYAKLGEKDKIGVLEDLYRREFGKKPQVPDAEELQTTANAPKSGEVAGSAAPAASDIVVMDDVPATNDLVVTDDVPAPTASVAKPVAAKEPATRRERKAARRQGEVDWLEAQLRPRFRADATARTTLAHARATAVQDALLSGGKIDPVRVFLDTSKSPVEKDEKVRMELALR